MLAQEMKNVAYPPLGLFPTYCFEHDKDTLRVTYDLGSQLTLRSKIGSFSGRTVVIDQTTTLGSINAIRAHIDELKTMPLNDGDFTPSQDLEKLSMHPAKVSSDVIEALALSRPTPIYPERAKANHVSGIVLVGATIGRDGRVHAMTIISAPDVDLAIAALAAVRAVEI